MLVAVRFGVRGFAFALGKKVVGYVSRLQPLKERLFPVTQKKEILSILEVTRLRTSGCR